MEIIVEPVKGKDLKPGELFSAAGDEYWQHRNPKSIGEKVYIRTDAPLTLEQEEEETYRILIVC